jgi:hypothetical protein
MAIKQDAISNYLDTVDLVPQLYDDEDQNFPVLSPEQIRELIIRNDAQLRGELRPFYGDSISTTTPYAVTPIARYGNSSAGKLLLTNGTNDIAVSTGASIYTQVYKLTFTSTTAFDCESDLTGSQGNGTIGSNFTTTDTFVTINSALWNGSFFNADVHYLKIYNHEQMLAHLSALLTAQYILDTIYTEEVPDASATAEKYGEKYKQSIRMLRNGTAFLEKGLTKRDINPIQVDYEIDEYGNDATKYRDTDWNPRTGI